MPIDLFKNNVSAYFTVLLSKEQKCTASKAKMMRCVRRRCIYRKPKLVSKFSFRQFLLEDLPRPGRPLEADVDKMKSLVDANRRITTREIAERLNLSNATVHKHMERLGLIPKIGLSFSKIWFKISFGYNSSLLRICLIMKIKFIFVFLMKLY